MRYSFEAGAPPEMAPPALRLLGLGEFLGQEPAVRLGTIAAAGDLSALLQERPLRLVFELPVTLAPRPETHELRLEINGLADLSPDALAAFGVLALFSPSDTDVALVLRAPTLFRAGEREGGVSLPYQLLAGRVAQVVADLLPGLEGGGPDAVRGALTRHLEALVAGTGAGAAVEVEVSPCDDGVETTLRIRAGRAILGGAKLELGFIISR